MGRSPFTMCVAYPYTRLSISVHSLSSEKHSRLSPSVALNWIPGVAQPLLFPCLKNHAIEYGWQSGEQLADAVIYSVRSGASKLSRLEREESISFAGNIM
jgi:hypothetical protein